MFRAIRRLSRPVGVLLLAILVSPGIVAECQPVGDVSAPDMPCCHKQSEEASFEAECCVVRQPAPGSENSPITTPRVRTVDGKEFLPASATVAMDVAAPLPLADPRAAARRLPQDRLYLRNSAIRR